MINNKKNTVKKNENKKSFIDTFGEMMMPVSPRKNQRMLYVNAGGGMTYIIG